MHKHDDHPNHHAHHIGKRHIETTIEETLKSMLAVFQMNANLKASSGDTIEPEKASGPEPAKFNHF